MNSSSPSAPKVRRVLSPVPPIPAPVRIGCFLIDFLLLTGLITLITILASGRAGWNLSLHVFFPLCLLPLANYLLHRVWGSTPGLWVFDLEKRTPTGDRATRLYDWLFLLQTRKRGENLHSLGAQLFLLLSAFVLWGGTSAFLWMRDPTLRPFESAQVPLYAPEVTPAGSAEKTTWAPLPFFYATGAFPVQLAGPTGNEGRNSRRRADDLSVEFDLPYLKGPPNRFLGRIVMFWRDFDAKLTVTGPLTLASPGTPDELRDCLTRWFGGSPSCVSARRGLWKNAVLPLLENRTILRNEWFTVENSLLPEAERARGFYLQTRPEKGRVKEIYFIVGPKMATQGFALDRPESAEGQAAGETLRKIIGSLRISSDLAAPRAFLDPKLAALRIGPKTPIGQLVAAEGLLLAKVSIEPKNAEAFYHLSGLAITLYRTAKREGRIELSASSRRIVKSALQYANDVDPQSKRLAEMERFRVEVDAK